MTLAAAGYQVFPVWIVIGHFANILFVLFMIRSGLEVLSAFPKFYLSDDWPPGRKWLRLTRKVVSADAAHPWSSLDEEDSWDPVIALPGRKNLGLGRHWHFMTLQFWVVRAVGYYLMFRLPPKLPGLPFNAVQLLSYFFVVFLLAPFQVLTGAAMSPSVIGRFRPGRRSGLRVTLVDRHDYHTFTPFLYQVATALLEPSGAAHPIRSLIRGLRNVGFLMALATAQQGRDTEARAWFERNRAACGPPGLLTEEFGVASASYGATSPRPSSTPS